MLGLITVLTSAAQAGGAAGQGQGLPPLPQTGRQAPPQLTAAITDGTGAVVIAWSQKEATPGGYTAGTDRLYAARLGPGGWTRLGGLLNEDARHNVSRLQAQLGPDGQPWLSWAEDAGIAHVDSTILSRWDGRAWSASAHYALRRNLSDAGKSSAFAVLPDGVPFLVWVNIYYPGAAAAVVQIAERNEPSWTFGRPLNVSLKNNAFFPAAAAALDGTRYAAWLEGDVARSAVRVARQRPGEPWKLLGDPLNFRTGTYTSAPVMRLTPAGEPVVAWLEDHQGLDHVFVKRWNGMRWVALGAALNVNAQASAARPSLALDQQGQAVVAWAEQRGQEPERVYVRRWTGRTWTLLGGAALNTSLQARAYQPSVTVDGAGHVVVAWCQESGVLVRRF
ncbi:hypothetical protein D3875_01985 [Deinococcus cavernae]|uniref:Exo-alpha-sialidase n=1 Tax=Deinococcus cavernae TaxID=2320857 RepID=A0A418VGN3_9DEIO|nr:hypothetical protein [Deinococcus cavernae]RJF75290.1 hypothetical protein D3875_01985 [Deinococcus cavernae]